MKCLEKNLLRYLFHKKWKKVERIIITLSPGFSFPSLTTCFLLVKRVSSFLIGALKTIFIMEVDQIDPAPATITRTGKTHA